MKTKVILILLVAVIVSTIFFFGFPATKPLDVTLDVTADYKKEGPVIVYGLTNLPDGTEINVSITNEYTGLSLPESTIVKDGRFKADFLTKAAVDYGKYLVDVSMIDPEFQPVNIQKIIGKSGELLSGKYVTISSLGEGKSIEHKSALLVGDVSQINNSNQNHKDKVEKILGGVTALLNIGYSMEKYRNTENQEERKKCFDSMRENRPVADLFVNEADTLPMRYYDLKFASRMVISCISCSDNAIENCSETNDSLSELKRFLASN